MGVQARVATWRLAAPSAVGHCGARRALQPDGVSCPLQEDAARWENMPSKVAIHLAG